MTQFNQIYAMTYKEKSEMLRRLRKSVVSNSNDFAREAKMSSKTIIRIERGFLCEPPRG